MSFFPQGTGGNRGRYGVVDNSIRDEFVALLKRSGVLRLVDLSLRESIVEIAINNPPHNYFTVELMEQVLLLQKMFAQVGEAKMIGVRGIIITGSGRSFSAGASLDMLGCLTEKRDQERVTHIMREIMTMIEECQIPVIAAINGICLGAGLELALACHYRVCAERIHLGFPEINLDLMPGATGTQTLPRLIGRSRAQYLLLSGKLVTAEDALRIGLVDVVVSKSEVMNAARGIAADMCFKNEKATTYLLRVVTAGLRELGEKSQALESELFWELVRDKQARGVLSSDQVGINKGIGNGVNSEKD
jgi:enoyl-CoA hydratase/carnithine racemase